MTEVEFETTREELRALLMETIAKLDEATDRQPRLLNEAQAAKYLGVSVGTLRNWKRKNIGPRSLDLKGSTENTKKDMTRYDIIDLDKWISEHPRRKERTE